MKKGKVLYYCKNSNFGITLMIIMTTIYILSMILLYSNISIFTHVDEKFSDVYQDWLFGLFLFLAIILILKFVQNYDEPSTIKIYENGIEVPKQRHIFKIIFITADDVKTIYPNYGYEINNLKDKTSLEYKKINFMGFWILLKNDKKYLIIDNKNKDNMKIAYFLKIAIGNKWDNIFDKHYEAKNISEGFYNWMVYLNKNGKLSRNANKPWTFRKFALAQLYDEETGENSLVEKVGEITEKYKNLWKNVEGIPDNFSLEKEK